MSGAAPWLALALLSGLGSGRAAVGTELTLDHRVAWEVPLTLQVGEVEREETVARGEQQRARLSLEADGLTVVWSRYRHRAQEPGYAHDRALPVEGRGYRRRGQRIVAIEGGEVTEEEAATVRQVALFAQLQGFREMLGPDPAEGVALPVGDFFGAILAEAPGQARVEGHALLLPLAGPGALREVELVLTLSAAGEDRRGLWVETRVEAEGRAWLDEASGLARRFELDGSVALTIRGRGVEGSGRGRFEARTRIDPVAPSP